MRAPLSSILACCLVLCALAGAAPAQATWTGASSSSWFDLGNWSTGQLPDDLVDVTVPATAVLPDIPSGVASCRNLDVLEGALVSVGGTGGLEVHGDLTLVASLAGTGGLALDTVTSDVTIFGAWNQDDPSAVTSNGGQVLFQGGSSIAGAGVFLPEVLLSTGTVTLLADAGFGHLAATGGVSAGSFDWVVTTPDATLAVGSQPVHGLRVEAGKLSVSNSEVGNLTLLGGELFIEAANDLLVATQLDLQAGAVGFGNLGSSSLRIGGSLIAAQAVTWASGYVDMDGPATTIQGPGGGTAYLNRLRLKSGTVTLLAPVEIASWVGSVGGASAGDWIELVGASSFLSSSGGTLHQVRVKAGLVNVFSSTVDTLELVGGILRIVGGQTLDVDSLADLSFGEVIWSSTTSSKFRMHGDLIAGPGVTFGDGFVEMDGTTTIDGPGGTSARLGQLRLLSGTCDLLHPVKIDQKLEATGGTSTGDWFEMVGTDTTLGSPLVGSTAPHQVRIVSGSCKAETGTVGALELVGGILELGDNETLTVSGDAELLGGQLSFSGSDTIVSTLHVQGDVHQVATTATLSMSQKGRLVCGGTWDADGAIDLGESFVEFADGASITGALPLFTNLRLGAGATVSLLNVVEIVGRLENAGGTSQGLWFECNGPSAVLATGANPVSEVRITGGVTTSEDASVTLLKLEGGELVVGANDVLSVVSSLELTGGSLSLDPLNTGLPARIEVAGNVTMLGTVAAVATGSGGSVRCDGLWFGNGPADFGEAFVELGPTSTVLGALASFGRVRFVDGPVSLNTTVPVTKEIVVGTGATVVGFFPLHATPGAGNVLELSGEGTIAELHVLNGTVEAIGGDLTLLRIPGGSFVATGAVTGDDVFLEGGSLVAREGGALDLMGTLELTAGQLDFELDPAGATGLAASLAAQDVHQVGATAGAGLAEGVLRCRGVWTGDLGLDLGLGWVELGDALSAASVTGSAPSFGNLRLVAGAVDLVGPVAVTGRLESDGATTSGDWFELTAAELASGDDVLHAVRLVGGQTRGFTSTVAQLELVAGELLVDGASTVKVTGNLELLGGQLGFDVGAPAARLEVAGSAHQVATVAGTVTDPTGALLITGELVVDAPLALGSSFVELGPGARLLGSGLAVDRLRIVAGALGDPAATLEATGGVTTAFEIEAGARFRFLSGGLAVLPPSVTLDGTLEVAPGAFLALAPTTTLTIAASGRLGLAGDSAVPAEVKASFGGGYQLVIDGQLGGRYFVVRDMASCVLTSSATIGPEGLHAGSFERGAAGATGPLVELQQQGSFDFVGLSFEGGAGDSNLRRAAGVGVGEVVVHAYGGGLGGPAFEDDPSQGGGDPDGLLVWENLPQADLVVLDLTSAAEAVVGWPLAVDFSVVNQGAQPAVGPWTDRLLLSTNDVVGDADDVLLVDFVHAGDEAGGGLYPSSVAPTMPALAEGLYWLALLADADDAVPEPGFEDNNSLVSLPFELFATPRPNLVVAALDGPTAADDGTVVEVTWTVKNLGLGATDEGTGLGGIWQDRVYLSSDAVFGGDFLLATFDITAGELPGGIAPGGSYTRTESVTLPAGISGPYYWIVRADAIDQVAPESREDDNVLVALAPLVVSQPDLPDLLGSFSPVTSPLGALYTNDEVELDWLVTNVDADANGLGSANGAWRERFYFSFDTQLDLGLDTLIFEEAHEGVVVPLGSYGGTRTIQLPALPGTWFLLGEADALGELSEGDEANNLWFQPLSVAAPGWTASVATTFTEGLASTGAGTQQITLTGQSTKPGSVQLVPNVEVTLRVRQGSSRRVFTLTTDAIGGYSFLFEPLVGEAGTFDVFCDHPAVEENPLSPQASFKLHRLGVAPLDYSASLVTGETRRVSFGISNPGADPLVGLGVTPVGLPAHLALTNLQVPVSLAAGASDIVTFELVALGDAPDPPGPGVPASFQLDFVFDLLGVPTVAASVPAAVWVTPFTPDLVTVGLAASAQVDAFATTQLAFQIVNQGGAPVTGATLAIDDLTTLGLTCIFSKPFQLAVPKTLGTIGPGESRMVAINVLAAECSDLGVGAQVPAFTTTVTANEGTWSFPVQLIVSAAPQTTLTISVEDAAAWWTASGSFQNGNGPGLGGAIVTLTDPSGIVTSLVTDGSGNAVFTGLAGCVYGVTIEPPAGDLGHQGWSGAVQVAAGQATSFEAYLPAVPAHFELVGTTSATATTPGQLDFQLVTTSAASPQAARLEVEGALLDFDLAVGETAQLELLITNTGGAPAEGIELFTTGVSGLSDFVVVPTSQFLGTLVKGASLPLVLTVTRTGLGDPCDLLDAQFGLRYFETAREPVWYWQPLFVAAPDGEAGCASDVRGGAPPMDLPPPLPSGPAAFIPAPYLGTGRANGSSPFAPVRPLPPVFSLPL